nr:hypothetical protein [uncultured bacterium]
MKFTVKIALALCVFCAAAFGQYKPKIALYIADDELPVPEQRALMAKFLVPFTSSGMYSVIDRSDIFLQKASQERIKQRDGSVNDNEVLKIGQEAGAKYVCIVDLVKAFGAYNVSARLVDVETAEIYLTAGETEINGNLNYEMKWAADKIFKQIHGKSQGASSATSQPPAAQPHYSQQQQSNPQQPIQQQDNSATGATAFIATEPTHADIYIGGKLIGRANEGLLHVPVGKHEVRFVKGDLEKTETMTFRAGQNGTLTVSLGGKKYTHSGDFTSGERLGAMFVNWIIPGVGSGVMMKDGKGAGTTWGLLVGGLVVALVGVSVNEEAVLYSGAVIFLVGGIYNLVRPWTYQGYAAANTDNPYGDVRFAVIPDKNGDLKAVVAYGLSF